MQSILEKEQLIRNCKNIREEYRKSCKFNEPINNSLLEELDTIERLVKSHQQDEARALFHEFAMHHPQFAVCRNHWECEAKKTQIGRIKNAISIKFGGTDGDNKPNK